MANLVKSSFLRFYSISKLHFKSVLVPSCLNARYFSSTSHCLSRKYAEKHEWVSVQGDIGTVGVSEYAQEALGEVVYVQLPEIGTEIEKDGEIGVVESVKAVNELYSPVSGTVTEVNEILTDQPGLINESCYDKGWVFKLKLTDPKELDTLMDEIAYKDYLKSFQ